MNNFLVFSGTATRYLTEKICASLGIEMGNINITHFADGEFTVSYEESIRGRDVFLVQSTFPKSDNLMELLLMIDAAKRASARTINAVIPYFGWARQDRKDKPRVAIGAKLVADMLSVAGINRVITMDLHADQEQGFFDVPVDHLYASSRRPNEVASMQIIGDVKDADVVLVDDIVDTAGTITKAADLMMENGAHSVRAIASHCVMSGPASERVQASQLEEMVFTDSIPYSNRCAKVKQITIADLIAETIRRVEDNESISSQYLI